MNETFYKQDWINVPSYTCFFKTFCTCATCMFMLWLWIGAEDYKGLSHTHKHAYKTDSDRSYATWYSVNKGVHKTCSWWDWWSTTNIKHVKRVESLAEMILTRLENDERTMSLEQITPDTLTWTNRKILKLISCWDWITKKPESLSLATTLSLF